MDGHEIRTWRIERGWTQAELAERLGVRVATVSDWERDATGRKLRESRLIELALCGLECEAAKNAATGAGED